MLYTLEVLPLSNLFVVHNARRVLVFSFSIRMKLKSWGYILLYRVVLVSLHGTKASRELSPAPFQQTAWQTVAIHHRDGVERHQLKKNGVASLKNMRF